MPQLDKVTYLSQVFWLFVMFFSFYIIILKWMLPTIVTILKLRQRKIDSDSQRAGGLETEEKTIIEDYNLLLKHSFSEAQGLLQASMSDSNAWLKNSADETNKTGLLSANKAYVRTVGDLVAQKYVFSSSFKGL